MPPHLSYLPFFLDSEFVKSSQKRGKKSSPTEAEPVDGIQDHLQLLKITHGRNKGQIYNLPFLNFQWPYTFIQFFLDAKIGKGSRGRGGKSK